MTDFLVPDLGEGLEDATVSSWSVAAGDVVELNQTLCTLETAKAEVEIPSPYAGRVVELGGAVGDVLAVGAVLVRIETGIELGEDGIVAPKTAKTNGAVHSPEPPDLVSRGSEPPSGPSRNPVLVGYGADADSDTTRRADRRPRAKPSVRKLAAELLVDLASVPPGPDGVITREAVLAAAGVHGDQRPSYDLQPVRGVHAEMAKRMSLSRSQIPDAHASVEVDGTRLLELADRFAVTPFVLTLRLLALALTHHRMFNATWVEGPDGSQVRTAHGVHLGIAVAAARGLLVPVVRDAHTKNTRELSDEVTRLVEGARAGTLRPAELTGSTFTVSNFGALGLDYGVPVINYPEAAILGMGSLRPRAVVIDGALAVRSTMTLTCAFDHRVADGAQVAGFLGELRGLLEAPETALLDL
ncbi:MAG TPA: dihydrolipoamide acetyltransferase family protein [Mycobacterium sp.]|nr:dihydrolipoamide acetyltransferase family protein [Mycobacterium sp.]